MTVDPALRDHKTWIGYLQPDGLVVSPAALVDAQVILDRPSPELQTRFQAIVEEIPQADDRVPAVTSLRRLVCEFLEWPEDRVVGLDPKSPIPESLKIPLRDFGETLEPTLAFRAPKPDDPERPWILLIQELPLGTNLDEPVESKLAGWSASPTRRFERLLREAQVPIGLLTAGTHLRLVYAPRGENAGTLTFPVRAMTETAGRPILGAFHLLLSRYRLLAAPSEARLPALLKRSRDYQSRVSTALAQQVLDALYELLRGFQAAHDQSHQKLLAAVLADDPDQIYSGLLSVLMRMVFLLYAEDQGLMPDSDLYARNYSLHGLFEKLRADAEQYADTMENRYGGWAQLLALFRAVHGGCIHPLFKMPAREGHLFDPERYPFLEADSRLSLRESSALSRSERQQLPLVPDGTIFRVLEKLLVLSGERLSYRTLDVEQIGSVYETMMGFRLRQAAGKSIALKAAKSHGAPTPVNLDELLQVKPTDRAKRLQEWTDTKLTPTMTAAVKEAESVDELLAALEGRIARNATPQPVAEGVMVLVPTDERRKSGSHYTPRSLTGPIVRTTLEPVLKQLGEQPTPEQILGLKVCDPAMGSGAFLVEACRQLADCLVAAWVAHGYQPYIPPDEDQLLHARRLVAQRCLYGVDRNPMAVDLAKLSLWLATLAKDHPFTFLDHTLRTGDSLVGLTRKQIVGFDLEPKAQVGFVEAKLRKQLDKATSHRRAILEAGDEMLPGMKQQKLAVADEQLQELREIGDTVVAAFFSGTKPKEREAARQAHFVLLRDWLDHQDNAARLQLTRLSQTLRAGTAEQLPVTPFHWEIEYPEVFGRETPGFDAFVGNPPFLGGKRISTIHGDKYKDFLLASQEDTNGNMDLVARFFRRTYAFVRDNGVLGLIATNTIAQGDTRRSGLQWICRNGGNIYACLKRFVWPGNVAVVVSVVHIIKGQWSEVRTINGKNVDTISAFLFHAGKSEDPETLLANANKSFIGCDIKGQGFIFGDDDPDSTPTSEYFRLSRGKLNHQILRCYMSGEEINDSPTFAPNRWVINFGTRTLDECKQWPELLSIIDAKVRPERMTKSKELADWPWWQFWRTRQELYDAIDGMSEILALSRVNSWVSIARVKTDIIYSEAVVLFALNGFGHFAVLQSRIHDLWARFLSSTALELLRYSPSNSFETLPFPSTCLPSLDEPSRSNTASIDNVGREYYDFRAALMVKNNEGLTKTYNRFHDPGETSPEILKLRELHDAMDRAVLDAYGWTDLRPTCEFLLDYEEDEEEEDSASESKGKKKKKPWRYRWPDDLRDEVLARLLKLNAERAAEERRTGAAAAAKPKKPSKSRKAAPAGDLFAVTLPSEQKDALVLLRAWNGKPLTRRALNAGMILIRESAIRAKLLGTSKRSVKKQDVAQLNDIYTELSAAGYITIDNTGGQQVVRVSPTAPATDDMTQDDHRRLNEVKRCFELESQRQKAQLNEVVVDAEFDFVSAGS